MCSRRSTVDSGLSAGTVVVDGDGSEMAAPCGRVQLPTAHPSLIRRARFEGIWNGDIAYRSGFQEIEV